MQKINPSFKLEMSEVSIMDLPTIIIQSNESITKELVNTLFGDKRLYISLILQGFFTGLGAGLALSFRTSGITNILKKMLKLEEKKQ